MLALWGIKHFISKDKIMNSQEIAGVQNFLRQKFGTDRIRVKARKEADDSVEVLLGEEFIGVIYRDEDEGEVSYDFNMAILDVDVKAAKAS
tara:strand:- start:1888 stop:2160 length:273 start_codon:yes stop_codon:yes gene_type:complete